MDNVELKNVEPESKEPGVFRLLFAQYDFGSPDFIHTVM